MRIFLNQTNDIWTDPVINDRTKIPETTAAATAKLWEDKNKNVQVPDSSITMNHTSAGVYLGTFPELEELIDATVYYLEMEVRVSGVRVWYFFGPITARLRNENTNEP